MIKWLSQWIQLLGASPVVVTNIIFTYHKVLEIAPNEKTIYFGRIFSLIKTNGDCTTQDP